LSADDWDNQMLFFLGKGYRVAEDAKALNASRVVELPIDVASHTSHLARASSAFQNRLALPVVRSAPSRSTRLLSGIDGSPVIDVRSGLDKLAA
jgi:[acyl-carrier-protein] S-malonyltransferase